MQVFTNVPMDTSGSPDSAAFLLEGKSFLLPCRQVTHGLSSRKLPSSFCVRVPAGKLPEGLTVFALKGGNLMRRVGINEFESGNMALEAAHSTRHL
jgi:hypothetical protein